MDCKVQEDSAYEKELFFYTSQGFNLNRHICFLFNITTTVISEDYIFIFINRLENEGVLSTIP